MRSNDLFSKVEKATRTAFDRVGTVTGTENDPDLSLYQTLAPNDFTELMKEYGEENILSYIKTMESRRAMGGKNGN